MIIDEILQSCRDRLAELEPIHKQITEERDTLMRILYTDVPVYCIPAIDPIDPAEVKIVEEPGERKLYQSRGCNEKYESTLHFYPKPLSEEMMPHESSGDSQEFARTPIVEVSSDEYECIDLTDSEKEDRIQRLVALLERAFLKRGSRYAHYAAWDFVQEKGEYYALVTIKSITTDLLISSIVDNGGNRSVLLCESGTKFVGDFWTHTLSRIPEWLVKRYVDNRRYANKQKLFTEIDSENGSMNDQRFTKFIVLLDDSISQGNITANDLISKIIDEEDERYVLCIFTMVKRVTPQMLFDIIKDSGGHMASILTEEGTKFVFSFWEKAAERSTNWMLSHGHLEMR